jgi:HlyD family secretion protein
VFSLVFEIGSAVARDQAVPMKSVTTLEPANGAGPGQPETSAAPIPETKVPPPHRWRRWGALALLGALAAGGVAVYRYVTGDGAPSPYRAAPVERGALTASVSATGNLNAVVMVLVGSQVSGMITELHADFNTAVRKGQIIARIDPALFEAAVNQARADVKAGRSTVLNQEAQVEQASTNVDNARAAHAEARALTAKALVAVVDARRTLARQTELFERGLVAAADRDSAQTVYDAALAQHDSAVAHEQALASLIRTAEAQRRVQQAMLQTARDQVEHKEAVLSQAQVNLDHTTIRSPVDGVVVNRAVDVGQTVAATLQAPTLFTIAQDLTRMQVEASVDEADIGRIRPDTPVTFTVDAFRGEVFTGAVSQIRKAPQIAQNVVTYTVVVAVANPSARLVPGMTANVRFLTAERPDVLKIPNAALRFRPSGAPPSPAERGRGVVWILGPDGRPIPIQVTLGITDGTSTEIVGGDLEAAQEVLIGLEPTAPTTPAIGGPGFRL